MELTPREVHATRFHDAWRGYSQREVDDFLERVAEALAAAERAHREMSALVAELQKEVAGRRESGAMLEQTLTSARRAAEEAVAAAETRAGELVAAATERARVIEAAAADALREAEAGETRARLQNDREQVIKRRRLDASIARLERFEADLRLRLSAFLEGQAQALRALESTGDAALPPARPGSGAHGERRGEAEARPG